MSFLDRTYYTMSRQGFTRWNPRLRRMREVSFRYTYSLRRAEQSVCCCVSHYGIEFITGIEKKHRICANYAQIERWNYAAEMRLWRKSRETLKTSTIIEKNLHRYHSSFKWKDKTKYYTALSRHKITFLFYANANEFLCVEGDVFLEKNKLTLEKLI